MAELNKNIERNIIKYFEKYKVESDLIDYKAIWDNGLTYKENMRFIKECIKDLSSSNDYLNKAKTEFKTREKTIKQEKEEQDRINLKNFKEEEENSRQELNKAINNIIAEQKNPELDKYFFNLKEYVKSIIKDEGSLNSLFVCSEGGFGKTTTILKTLQEEEKEYVYISNYTTLLEFVNFLYANQNKIIVLDDFENIFDNGFKFVNLLKGALWGIGEDNKRFITYLTTDERRKAPQQFEFKGKMIFLLNKTPSNKNPLMRALLSRSIVYNMSFSYEEILKILAEFVKLPYKNLTLEQRTEIFNFLKDNTDKTTINLNFRSLIKMFDLYRVNKENWKELVKPFFNKDERLSFLDGCLNSSSTIKEAQEKFCLEFGCCRKTFYNLKKKLEVLK